MRKIPLRHLLSKLTVLALSASPGVAVAQVAPATQCSDCADDGELDSDAVIDHNNVDPRDAAAMLGRSLANALGEVTPLSATHLATTWALSADPIRRAAIANALEWQFPLFGDAAIIDHLSRDTSPEVRSAIARAAWMRHTAPVDGDALRRLLDDADPDVRAIARRATA